MSDRDRLLTRAEVESRVGLTKTSIYRMMRPDGIIAMPPSFDRHFGLLPCREDLRVQDCVPEL